MAGESIDRETAAGELLAQVRAMVDDFRAAGEQTDRERRIPKESVERMVGAGLARALVPERFGGLELGLDVWFDVTRELAKAETSHGWCAGLMMHNPHYATYFPFAGQQEMWAGGPDVTVAGSLGPRCRVEPRDGGYAVSGEAPFASGVWHAMWSYVGGMIPDGSGGVEWAWFLIPADEYEVDDTWHTIAMRGTGSNTIVTDGVFVPEDRVLRAKYVIEGDVPGERPSENPMYRLPIAGYGPLGFSVTALGACEGALEEFQRWMAERRAPDGTLMADRPRFHFAVARIASNIDAAELLLRRSLEAAMAPTPPDPDIRARTLRDFAAAGQFCVKAIDELVEISGTAPFFQGNPIGRAWQDIHFMAANLGISPEANFVHWGRVALGVGRDPGMLIY